MLAGQRLRSHRLPRVFALVVAGAAAVLAPPAAARAEGEPQITSGPVIAGLAQVGETLAAQASATGTPEPVPAWRWVRCPKSSGSCSAIRGASSDTYRATPEDVGKVLRVVLKVTNAVGSAEKRSDPTAAVLAAPAPVPAPTPPPAPEQAPAPPSFELPPAAPPPAARPPARGAPAPALRLLDPFPVVRIKGWLTSRGARVTLLSVRAPRGSRVNVTCRGAGCPVPKLAQTAAIERLRRFERELRAGTRLELAVTKPGTIGKWTVIVIRRGAVPRRKDGCLDSDTKRHVRCPA